MSRGISSVFRREGARDFAAAEGSELDREKIEQVLATECSPDGTGGELPWRTDFGAPLHLLRHRNAAHVLLALARTWAKSALGRWAPRVPLLSIEASATGTEVRLDIRPRRRSTAAGETTTTIRRPR